jgi:hypothetical protein
MKVETILPGGSVAEIEVSYSSKFKISELPTIAEAKCAYQIFLEKWDKSKLGFIEQFKVLFLNSSKPNLIMLYNYNSGERPYWCAYFNLIQYIVHFRRKLVDMKCLSAMGTFCCGRFSYWKHWNKEKMGKLLVNEKL